MTSRANSEFADSTNFRPLARGRSIGYPGLPWLEIAAEFILPPWSGALLPESTASDGHERAARGRRSKIEEYPRFMCHPLRSQSLNIVTLCTGNVARSVMLGYMLTTADATGEAWHVRSAGTHVTEGAAMSGRTRDALLKIEELGDHRYGAHRSHQLNHADAEWADVMLAAEVDNVNFVRANFATFADKTIQLAQFVRYAPPDGEFVSQLRTALTPEPSTEFNVNDPAGGDQAAYDACARQLWELTRAFASLVGERVN